MPNPLSDALSALSRTINETMRRLDRLERQGTYVSGAGPAGTVTSVGLAVPSGFSVSGTPVVASGTLTLGLANQTANTIWAGPATGAAAAPTFRALVPADLGGMGSGTVTSVGLTAPSILSVTGTPVTTSGTLALALATQAANMVFVGPTSGGVATPTFRALVAADLPAIDLSGAMATGVLAAGRFPALTGDVTTVASALATTLATVNANVGTFGSTTDSVQITVNAKGLVTAISNQTIDRISGSGTAGYFSIFTGAGAIGNSAYMQETGGAVFIDGAPLSIGDPGSIVTIRPNPATPGYPSIYLPASSGTFALVSDITTAVNAAVVGTTSKIAKFTGTNAVGNSIMVESGAKIEVSGAVTVIGQSNINQLVVKGHSTQTAAQIQIQSSAGAEWMSIRGLANGSVMIGKEAGPSITSANSVAIGYRAMNGVTSSNSIAIGTQALEVMNTSGHSNIAIGYWAGKQVTGGLYNVLIGEGAGYALTSGINNFMLGTNAGWNLTGSDNICIGAFGMYYSTSAAYNTAVGSGAGMTINGSRNTIVGYYAGYTGGGTAVSFSDSVYVGTKSGYGSNAGSYNTAVGTESLQKVVANAVAVGYKAGFVQTGAGFTAVGYQAGVASTTGTNSTLIGSGAGGSLTTNGGAVMIGYQAGNAETAANKLYIANSSTTTPLIYGDFSTPSLTFNGTVNIADGKNIVLSGTTGTKLASAASEKLGVWGATPIIQPTTGVAAATFVAGAGTAVNDASTFDGYTLKQIVRALRTIGWLA